MGVINHVVQFERDLLIERTQSGLIRAKSQGKKIGRPNILSSSDIIEVKDMLNQGKTISSITRFFNTSRQTIMRIKANSANG